MASPVLTRGVLATRDRSGAAVVVRVAGEIDMATAPIMAAALRAGWIATVAPGPLVVDLSGVRFFSAAGLAALIATRRECLRLKISLRIVAADRCVLRPMRITGLDEVFDVTPSLADATRPSLD